MQCRHKAIHGSLFCRTHQHTEGGPRSGYEPPYDPLRYNGNPLIKDSHNCWSYSMNVIDPAQVMQCANDKTGTCEPLYHQPGGTKNRSGILEYEDARTCKTIEGLMRTDVPDIRRTTFKARCPAGTSKIAMAVHPGEDYHFYRQDSDGWWSHKDGSNRAKRFDADRKPIFNPATAARDYRSQGSDLNYKDFCGFYCVPRLRPIRLAI
jgi:hypothetical protein